MAGLSAKRIPAPALELARAFRQAGHGLWLVGGWVRDALLNRAADSDLDFTTDALPEQSLAILKRWSSSAPWTMGMEFGTVGVQHRGCRMEVTTLRREIYQLDSRNPEVSFGKDLPTDLSRRDFTVNAMAICLPEVEVIDLFGGLSDLAARTIRTPLAPETSFADDPLRMLRAFRFASVLDFQVDPAALEAIGRMHERLSIVSGERIRDELSKLMTGAAPSRALLGVAESGLAGQFLPELPGLRLEQDPIHRHKDVFTHTLAVLDNVSALDASSPDLVLRLAALLHDIGKPKTRAITPNGVTFHHHEVVGAQMTEVRMRELRFPANTVEEVKQLVYLHLRFHTFRLGWSDRAVRRYVRDAGSQLDRLNKLVRADCTTRNPLKAQLLSNRMDELEERIAELSSREELANLRPALNGDEVMQHLGITPSRLVGEALDFLMELRLDEGEVSSQEAYRRLEEWYRARG
ncbi:MAG: CCA tRNA nucleotidyltransferase [Actinomycetota bacterium]